MEFKENDLVMLRLPNNPELEGRQRHYNTWFRVMFIDNDETFVGRCELIDWSEFTWCEKGEDIVLRIDKVQHVFQQGEEFCYGDNITICQCTGLCRNK